MKSCPWYNGVSKNVRVCVCFFLTALHHLPDWVQCIILSKSHFGLWIGEELGWQQNCCTLGWWLAKPLERQLIPNKKDWILDDTLIALFSEYNWQWNQDISDVFPFWIAFGKFEVPFELPTLTSFLYQATALITSGQGWSRHKGLRKKPSANLQGSSVLLPFTTLEPIDFRWFPLL